MAIDRSIRRKARQEKRRARYLQLQALKEYAQFQPLERGANFLP